MATCISFLRVPDISTTITWYESIGFHCLGTHQEQGCDLDWALMDWQGAQFMLYPEGRSSHETVRDSGLYITVEEIDSLIPLIQSKAEVVEINPCTEYGMKEIVFKDFNGFQVTFGCKADVEG